MSGVFPERVFVCLSLYSKYSSPLAVLCNFTSPQVNSYRDEEAFGLFPFPVALNPFALKPKLFESVQTVNLS